MSNRILSIALTKSNLKPSGFTRLDLKSLVKNTNISKLFAIAECKIQWKGNMMFVNVSYFKINISTSF